MRLFSKLLVIAMVIWLLSVVVFSLFGVSIGLWVISEFLYNFYSNSMRFYSGFVGYLVLWIFGTSPYDVALNIEEFWWTLLFWLPGLIATQRPESKRKYNPWFFA